MEGIEKIAALAVTAALCAGIVRRGASEFSLLIVLAAGICILVLSTQALEQVLQAIRDLAELARMEDAILRPVLKTVAISLVVRITAELCRSAGEGGLAAFVETSGTVLGLMVSLPLAKEVLELMAQLLT